LRPTESVVAARMLDDSQGGKDPSEEMTQNGPYTLEWIRRLLTTPLMEGRDLLELTTFAGMSLWWFVHYRFCNAMLTYAESARRGKAVASHLSFLSRVSRTSSWLRLFYSSLLMVICRLNSWLYLSRKNVVRPRILFTAQTVEWRRMADPISGKTRKTDLYFDPIIQEMKRAGKYQIQSTYPLGSSASGLRVMIDKRLHERDIVHTPFEAFWSPSIALVEERARTRFKKLWAELQNNSIFNTLLNYREMNLLNALRRDIQDYFEFALPRAAANLATAERMIEKDSPNVILLQNECGPWERALIAAAKLKGVPTLATQHGIITAAHPGYYVPDGRFDQRHCLPIPDLTAVFGEYSRSVLTKLLNYPSERVIAVGNPQYDYIPPLLTHSSPYFRHNVCRELGLDPSRRIVLVATGALQTKYGYPDYDRLLLGAVFSAKLSRPELQLILKLHPKEDGLLQRTMARERGVSDFVIVKDERARPLWISDLAVTIHSAFAMEAIAMGKPLMVVNLTGSQDIYPYVTAGAAIGVYRQEDLLPAIDDILDNQQTRDRLAQGRQQFIQDHLNSMDGHSAERIIELVEQISKPYHAEGEAHSDSRRLTDKDKSA
jgi:glycosyltransferase involved in cell wall biosynthesis